MLCRPREAKSTYCTLSMSLNRISLLACAANIAFCIAACTTTQLPKSVEPARATPSAAVPGPEFKPVNFEANPGWGKDDQRQAWPAYLASCEVLVKTADRKEPCSIARDVNVAD